MMPPSRLWFDVEERYNTTVNGTIIRLNKLWFDVEERYNTTVPASRGSRSVLWFDVEERYNTTAFRFGRCGASCGLM